MLKCIFGRGACAATVESIGPEGETRYANPRFDNVNDYQGFCMGPGTPVCADAVPANSKDTRNHNAHTNLLR